MAEKSWRFLSCSCACSSLALWVWPSRSDSAVLSWRLMELRGMGWWGQGWGWGPAGGSQGGAAGLVHSTRDACGCARWLEARHPSPIPAAENHVQPARQPTSGAPDFHGLVAAACRVLALQRGGQRVRLVAHAALPLLPLQHLALLLQRGARVGVQQVALALKQLQGRLVQHAAGHLGAGAAAGAGALGGWSGVGWGTRVHMPATCSRPQGGWVRRTAPPALCLGGPTARVALQRRP